MGKVDMVVMRSLLAALLIAVLSACSPAPVAVADASVVPDATPAADAITKSNVVNLVCHTAADCAVKDVGSCCGYTPSCVNIDSPTFPESVSADCEREGTSSVCGFREVSRCECVEARCTSIYAGEAGLPVN